MPGCGPHTTMGPLKIISDGSLNTRTAWCCEPYADPPGTGAANYSPAELRELMGRASTAGLDVATHAIGDAAVAEALSAYADTGATGSIEHAQLVRREDLARVAALGLRASVQPAHLIDDRDVTDLCWGDRADRVYMFRSMLDAGIELALGSDAPVARLDPWLAMAAAVHRSGDEREAWQPQESLTPREALAASVDGHRGVRAGSPADLALLDHDPLESAGTELEQAARLRSTRVAATWVGGSLVHSSGLVGSG
jgi:predicted amidohydrolase YtcJ